jgi:5-methylcytosine-specific restriction protein B
VYKLLKKKSKKMASKPIQKILFGSPGTGKSYKISNVIVPEDLTIKDNQNVVKTVFHPEYTYGDFMGKLMPLTDDSGKVEYKYYTGHFLKILGRAYKNLIASAIQYDRDKRDVLDKLKRELDKNKADFDEEENATLKERQDAIVKKVENVVLVIDEINRGNSAAIFGTVFQLLDRDKKGWSEYHVTISDLELIGLLKEIGFSRIFLSKDKGHQFWQDNEPIKENDYNKHLSYIFEDLSPKDRIQLQEGKIKLPSNLSILATMNTSDNSIYFMDSAFKRRWNWEFVNVEDDATAPKLNDRILEIEGQNKGRWVDFVDKLNSFIRSRHDVIRKIEDKQIGYFFINEDSITEKDIKNKLMFFVWDGVFSNNKEPLVELLFGKENKKLRKGDLATFGQFTHPDLVKEFINKILEQQL